MRRYVAGLCTVGLVGAGVSVAAAPVAIAATAPAPAAFVCTPGTWVHQPANVLPSQGGGDLYAAAVATPTLAWAVGWYENSKGYGSLIEKWTGGTSWSVVGTGGKNVSLGDVAAFGASSAFAVGSIASDGGSGPEVPVVTHWNGSTWTRTNITLPAGAIAGDLIAVSGSSSSDVFAIGDSISKGRVSLLVEHWNGSAWTQVTMPSAAKPNSEPVDVLSVGPGDMWMEGYATSGGAIRFWHYNGTWTLEATPPGLGPLAGTSDTNIWLVGHYTSSGTPLEHFNGSSWSPTDNNGNGNVVVADLALGASASTVWSDGYYGASGGTETVSIAKNGVAQTVPALTGSLNGIGTGSGLAFAVGNSNEAGTGVPIVLASCD
jgi:hypothetical protein